MKPSLGDRALVWGTVSGILAMVIGALMWVTQIAYTTSSTAQAQEKFHDEVSRKLDEMSVKLDELNAKTARIEGEISNR